MNAKQGSDTQVKSATRAVDILEFVAESQSAPTFRDIAAGLGIPNSSLFYLLSTLSNRGYLTQESERGGYALGPAVNSLAYRRRAQHSWRDVAIPLLDQVTDALNETSTYAERRGDEIECVASKLANQALLPVLRAGQRAPLYVFSGGKVLLANMSDEALEDYLRRTTLERLTVNTIASGPALKRELAKVRACGFGYSRGEHTLGIIGISTALRTPRAVIGTIGVAVAAVRFTKQLDAAICKQLAAATTRFLEASKTVLAKSER
ncbi:MAG TPA: IclR family transcriptional regulator [Steroidobacteraceae bacterium]|nr:IclR family transcriptional regulator [Steroidobacteraceae bacterium]